MLLTLILLVIGFVLLIRGGDVFVDSAASLAHRSNIPAIVIGTTVVAIGTSAPEAAISIIAAIKGSDGVSVGNVIGSNITNIFLILGITAIIGALPIHKNTKKYELPFVGFITILLGAFGIWLGQISRFAAITFLLLFAGFMIYSIIMARRDANEPTKIVPMPTPTAIFLLLVSLFAIIYGSNMVVHSATDIAHALGVSDRIIGLTLVAFGTSLPELVVCIAAVLRKQYDIAIGNIVGSNIFNILFVLGLAAFIKPIPFQAAFLTDTAVALLAVVMLMLFTYKDSILTRLGGIIFVLSYIGYTAFTLM